MTFNDEDEQAQIDHTIQESAASLSFRLSIDDQDAVEAAKTANMIDNYTFNPLEYISPEMIAEQQHNRDGMDNWTPRDTVHDQRGVGGDLLCNENEQTAIERAIQESLAADGAEPGRPPLAVSMTPTIPLPRLGMPLPVPVSSEVNPQIISELLKETFRSPSGQTTPAEDRALCARAVQRPAFF
jgi:hypothetical protein